MTKRVEQLSQDAHPWEQQEGETPEQYVAFCAYRDSTDRNINDAHHDPYSARKWAKQWLWSYRAHQWDLFVTRQENEKLVRYRLKMDERHRQIAQNAQSKVVQWLQSMQPTAMSATEAVKMLEISVKLERQAAHADDQDEIQKVEQEQVDSEAPSSVEELLQESGMSEHDLAEALYRAMPE